MQWCLVSSLLPGFELGGTEVGYFGVGFEGAVPCCGGTAANSWWTATLRATGSAPRKRDEVTAEMKVYEYESFGPVLCLVRVDSLEGAMELTENNQFGNGVALFTRDGGMARHSAGLHEHRDIDAID